MGVHIIEINKYHESLTTNYEEVMRRNEAQGDFLFAFVKKEIELIFSDESLIEQLRSESFDMLYTNMKPESTMLFGALNIPILFRAIDI